MKCDNPTCTNEVSKKTARRVSRFHHCSRACRYANPAVMIGVKKAFGPNPENRQERQCEACRQLYVYQHTRQKYCRICVPNGQALQRMQKYQLTQPQYDTLMQRQNHACALCFKTFINESRQPDVDHDHTTGRVRGLLCRACNQMMRAIDNVAWRERAMLYAQKDMS